MIKRRTIVIFVLVVIMLYVRYIYWRDLPEQQIKRLHAKVSTAIQYYDDSIEFFKMLADAQTHIKLINERIRAEKDEEVGEVDYYLVTLASNNNVSYTIICQGTPRESYMNTISKDSAYALFSAEEEKMIYDRLNELLNLEKDESVPSFTVTEELVSVHFSHHTTTMHRLANNIIFETPIYDYPEWDYDDYTYSTKLSDQWAVVISCTPIYAM